MKPLLIAVLVALGACAPAAAPEGGGDEFPVPEIEWKPLDYIARKTDTPPVIDGRLDDEAWKTAAWTDDFGDITGDPEKKPRFRTRAKIRWDDEHLYLGFEMEEPHVWGTLTKRDCVIFHDNDIEVFLDPDGDTHEYYEVELNALNTLWDLLVTKPYRDGGHGVNAWDIRGMKTAVHVDGTLNDPSDTDRGWSVEMAIPWGPIRESERAEGPPADCTWRVNFSRVQWRAKVVDGKYVKETDPKTGKPLPEDNWSWSPQGLVAMHYPEMWGYVAFADDPPGVTTKLYLCSIDEAEQVLRQVYYAQRRHHARHGRFAEGLAGLGIPDLPRGIRISATENLFEATLRPENGPLLRITQDGRLRRIRKESE